MLQQNYRMILASASPRRRELLNLAKFEFEVIPSCMEEIISESEPAKIVMELATQKAQEIFHAQKALPSNAKPLLVIGADTVVSYHQEILGKPTDVPDARRMLRMLSGNTHQVYTGVALFYADLEHGISKQTCFHEKTDVTFYDMTTEEIDSYIATGDPMDKAGSYGIQGPCAVHVKEICGDYNNVVGLPIARLYHEIKAFCHMPCTVSVL